MKNTEGVKMRALSSIVIGLIIFMGSCKPHNIPVSKKEGNSITEIPIPPPPSFIEDTSYLQDVCKNADIPPRYNDGETALLTFIDKNLKNPYGDNVLEGTVWISCIVETDGTLSHVYVKRGIAGHWNNEAIRIIEKTSGHWQCAYFKGEKVKTQLLIPVKCKIK